MQNLSHERHVPDPVQSHNGRRIKHPHLIAMDNFPYLDILCFGDGEGFVGKIRSNKKERKWPTNNKTRKERNISYLERHCLNLDYGCPSIVRHSFDHVKNSCGCWEIRTSFEPCANNKRRRVLVHRQQRISE